MSLRYEILRIIEDEKYLPTLGNNESGIIGTLKDKLGTKYEHEEILSTFWSLLSDGNIYFDHWDKYPANWQILISKKGKYILSGDERYNPFDPESYIKHIYNSINEIDKSIIIYLRESLKSFNNDCFLSSSVMLGVASEKAFLLLCHSFIDWLPDGKTEKENLKTIVDNPKLNFINKFTEFRKRIEPYKPELPSEFSDNMSLNLDSICDLIRMHRNESGHPTGKYIDKSDAYANIRLFASYLEKIYGLIRFFKSNS